MKPPSQIPLKEGSLFCLEGSSLPLSLHVQPCRVGGLGFEVGPQPCRGLSLAHCLGLCAPRSHLAA